MLLPKPSATCVPLKIITPPALAAWKKTLAPAQKRWLEANGFSEKPGSHACIPDTKGGVDYVVVVVDERQNIWSIAGLATALPPANYRLEDTLPAALRATMALGWALGGYRFTRYKKQGAPLPALYPGNNVDVVAIQKQAAAICQGRDLINTPANDMGPSALAKTFSDVAKQYKAECTVIRGDALLKQNYPTIHMVGRAAEDPPCLIDLRWGNPRHKKITLVGKGVCFDSGGLDIKGASNMLLMKKDMGGAAAALALARMIMDAKVPVRLRVLVPAVENSVAGNAFRPLDVVKTRSGKTVEVGNTDAEGRLILCDALYEADQEKPDLLLDFATLTGAARVALGTDIPALFTSSDALAEGLARHAAREYDPLWRLPLWEPYRDMLKSDVADVNNAPDSGYAGAITAALYLQEFVSEKTQWAHIDMMAWNTTNKPGRPKGGEIVTVRAIFAYIAEKYLRTSK